MYPVLRKRMKEQGISSKELAAVIGVSRITFYLKLWGITKWSLPEAIMVCCYFNTPDVEQLFLRNNIISKFWKCQGENYHV